MRILIPSPIFVTACLGAGAAFITADRFLPQIHTNETISAVEPSDQSSADPSDRFAVAGLPVLSDDQRRALAVRPLLSETRTPAIFVDEPIYEPEPEPFFEPEPIIEEPAFVEEALAEPEPPAPEPPEVVLMGYIRSDGPARIMLKDLRADTERWYSIGDQIEGWEIAAIAQDSVTFFQRGVEFVVKVKR